MQARKAYGEVGRGVSFMPVPLYALEQILRYPLNRRLRAHQRRSGSCAEERKKALFLPGIELRFLGRVVPNPVVVLTDVPRTVCV